MQVARHGDGPLAGVRAYASQVHPVFMLPPLAVSVFGATLAGTFDVGLAAVHLAAMFAAVYTAHVKDGYVDFYLRDEDDDHPLTAAGCRLGLAAATGLFVACVLALWWLVDPVAALVTLPTWFVGYLHAPQLDTNPVTATMGYPVGIGLSLLGGYYVQATAFAPLALSFVAVFVLLLSGVKVIDDAQDYEYDRSIAKRTVAVVLGRRRARLAAYAAMGAALLAVVAFTLAGTLPPSAVAAPAAFALVAALARNAGDELATMMLIRGAYVFLALLVVATWFRPLA